jgi:hypothetical protein
MRTPRLQTLFVSFVQAAIGFEWIKAGWEKITDPAYLSSMTGTLGAFAKDPFGWYKSFLTGVGIPNAHAFGVLAEWGELLVGLALMVAAALYLIRLPAMISGSVRSIALVSLVVAVFMSANYWFAAGYLSVSTDGLNMLMALIEIGLATVTGASVLAALRGRAVEPAAKVTDRAGHAAAA